VIEELPESITAGGEGLAEAEAQACVRRLAVTVWDQKRVWGVELGRIAVAPFTSQSSHQRNLQYFKKRVREVASRTTPATLASDRQMYLDALERKPDDTLVRWNYAQFLERTGLLSEAISQGQIICDILPHAPWPHYFVGSVMVREGRIVEAIKYLKRSLKIERNISQARKELEQIRALYPGL